MKKKIILDYLIITVGTALFALSVHVFTAPNNIAPGGAAGLATATAYLSKIPLGTLYFASNIPLIILGFFKLGKDFILKTLYSIVVFTILTDFALVSFYCYHGELIIVSIFGGILSGVGLALVFLRGGSTGGTDITNRIIGEKFPHFKLGNIVLITDAVVITFACFIFRNVESALFAIVTIFVQSFAMNKIMYGLDTGKYVQIITECPEEIAKKIHDTLGRGATIISAKGSYTDNENFVLLAAVRNNQFYTLKQIVKDCDKSAFMIVSDASEVLGEGFRLLED